MTPPCASASPPRRLRLPFDGVWSMRIDTPYSQFVREDGLGWSCGQLAMTEAATVVGPGDARAQNARVLETMATLLTRAGFAADAARRLDLFPLETAMAAAPALVAAAEAAFPRAAVSVAPVPHYYYEGVALEADLFAAEDPDGVVTRRMFADGATALSPAGALAYGVLSGPLSDLDTLWRALAATAATAGYAPEPLCAHWFAPTAHLAAAADAATALGALWDAGAVVDVGAGAGGDARAADALVAQVVFARAPIGASAVRDVGPARCVSREAGGFFWAEARPLDGAATGVAQTEAAMIALEDALARGGRGFEAVVKATTRYRGDASEAALHDNMAVRNARYCKPGPASTGLPARGFSAAESHVATSVLALA